MYRPVRPDPYIATGNIHPVIMVKLHFTSLVVTLFKPFVGIDPRSARWNKQTIWLAIVNGRRVIAVIMHGHLARRRVEIVRKRNTRCLPCRSADC
jgi:hypothetical protein